MPNLQRSCQACVDAKRRCDRTAPECRRCAKKSIACRYVNSPGKNEPRDHTTTGDNQSQRLQTPDAIDRPHKDCYPEVVRTFDPTSLQRLKDILLGMPEEFAEHGSATFIHRDLATDETKAILQQAQKLCTQGDSQQARWQIRLLLHQAADPHSYLSLLTRVQAAVILAIPPLLASSNLHPLIDSAVMWRRTHSLYEEAPSSLPELCPWKAWLLAESVRRTILVCNILLRVHMVLKQGYAVQSLCIEALPFDERTRLWEVRSEPQWQLQTESPDGRNLLSVAELVRARSGRKSESKFEELVLLAFQDVDQPTRLEGRDGRELDIGLGQD